MNQCQCLWVKHGSHTSGFSHGMLSVTFWLAEAAWLIDSQEPYESLSTWKCYHCNDQSEHVEWSVTTAMTRVSMWKCYHWNDRVSMWKCYHWNDRVSMWKCYHWNNRVSMWKCYHCNDQSEHVEVLPLEWPEWARRRKCYHCNDQSEHVEVLPLEGQSEHVEVLPLQWPEWACWSVTTGMTEWACGSVTTAMTRVSMWKCYHWNDRVSMWKCYHWNDQNVTYSLILEGCESSSPPITMIPFSLTLPVNLHKIHPARLGDNNNKNITSNNTNNNSSRILKLFCFLFYKALWTSRAGLCVYKEKYFKGLSVLLSIFPFINDPWSLSSKFCNTVAWSK